jgi:hypothetical protein
MYGISTYEMTSVGIQRLPASMLIPKWWKPLIESAVPSAIASSSTGKAQIRSKKREMIQSVRRRSSRRAARSIEAKKVQMIAEPIPTAASSGRRRAAGPRRRGPGCRRRDVLPPACHNCGPTGMPPA